MNQSNKTGWILCDKGKVGTYRQCQALAELIEGAYRIPFVHKEISLTFPWRYLPPHFAYWHKKPERLQGTLTQPYPSVVIAAGRQAVTAAMTFRRHALTIVLLNPHIKSTCFDLVIPPLHDGVKGPNVLSTTGALHPLHPEHLNKLRHDPKVLKKYESLPPKRIVVLVGGDNKYYRYTAEWMESFTNRLRELITNHPYYQGGSLLITPSRRTRPELIAIMAEGLRETSHQIWDGTGDNPYFDYLAIADALVVTGDSISMMSEACLMGRPVYIAEVPISKTRFLNFRESLYDKGHATPLSGELKTEGFIPLDELSRVKEHVLGIVKTFLKKTA